MVVYRKFRCLAWLCGPASLGVDDESPMCAPTGHTTSTNEARDRYLHFYSNLALQLKNELKPVLLL